MRVLVAMLALAACGRLEVVAAPNTVTACDRALVCGAILPGQHDACVACLEHVDPTVLADLREQHGDLPPLDTVSCETITSVIGSEASVDLARLCEPHKHMTIRACVVGRCHGP
jgi:hypothetical protein